MDPVRNFHGWRLRLPFTLAPFVSPYTIRWFLSGKSSRVFRCSAIICINWTRDISRTTVEVYPRHAGRTDCSSQFLIICGTWEKTSFA
ncbi:hypothetical protein BDV25DRAFT_166750 [Aspergillus avenaceus]|uniref:Uncharacterized protein n=1 Tax=Aspergillus avenaceus TaxID=36643 RepID=A0A5N6TDW9_ASPAV|nr:hypothetical protein BDV25DRAFT_166750 [Aspergillus avenaceus]